MGFNITVYHDLRLDAGITRFWENHQWHPHADLEYVRHEYQFGREGGVPCVMAISDRRDLVSCAIGKIEKLPLKLQFGYRIIQGPPLTTLLLHGRSFLGDWQHATCAFLMDHVLSLLATGTIDALGLRGIPLDSPLGEMASSKVPFLRRDHFPIVQEYWVLNQLDSFEAFLKEHHSVRRNFKECRNRLRRVVGNKVRIERYCHLDQLDQMLQHSETIGRKTWQRKLQDFSFLHHQVRAAYEFYFKMGWSRAFILHVNDHPAAFLHGLVYKGVFYAEKMGYDPAYRSLSLGTYLMMKVIEELCADPSINSMEFGVGNPEDKMRYCDSAFQVADMLLFGPGMRWWPLVLLRLMAQGSHQLGKQLSRKMGFYHSLRRHSRRGTLPVR